MRGVTGSRCGLYRLVRCSRIARPMGLAEGGALPEGPSFTTIA